jgi:exopolysaccharide production protein ExoQ
MSNIWRDKDLGEQAFIVIGFLILPVALFSSKAMAPLFIFLVLTLIGRRIWQKNFQISVPKLSLIAFIHLLIWAGLSQLWTFDAALSGKLLLSLLALFALGLFLIAETNSIGPTSQEKINSALAIGAGLAIALLIFESVTGSWLTRMGRGLTWLDVINPSTGGVNIEAYVKNGLALLSVLIWPVISNMWQRRLKVGAAAFLICTLYLIYRFSASTALIAFFTSALGVGLALYRKKFAAHLIAGVFAVLVLAMPFGVQQSIGDKTLTQIGQTGYEMKLPNSAINRLIIWQFATKKIIEKPLTGWGMNTARQIPGGNEKYTLTVINSAGKNQALFKEFYVPLHTHNQAIQIWLELGAIGAIFVAVFGCLFIRKLSQKHIDPAVFGVVISILAFNFLSFGAWQSWWIATQFLCLSLALVATKRGR